jgi:hypothetical protein
MKKYLLTPKIVKDHKDTRFVYDKSKTSPWWHLGAFFTMYLKSHANTRCLALEGMKWAKNEFLARIPLGEGTCII